MADVLLIEPRDAVGRPPLLVRLAHVPVGDQLHPVRVHQGAENDDVIQDPQRFGIGFRVQAVDRLDQLLGAEHFGRVQAAVDPDDHLALAGQGAGLFVGQVLGQRQPPVRRLDHRQLPLVFRRGDDRGELGPPFFGLADVDHRHPFRLRLQLLEIVGVLRVVDQAVIVADRKPELIFGRGDFRRRRRLLRVRRRNRDAHSQRDKRRVSLQHDNLVNKNGRADRSRFEDLRR